MLRIELLLLVDAEATMRTVDAFLDFCDLVNSQDYHECWSMTWLDTLRNGRSLTLRLGVHTGLEDMPDQVWEVGTRYTRVFSLVEFEFTAWTISDDHVLLWDDQEPFSQLNFRGPASSHGEILWDLFERHREIAEHWIPFERYINPAFLANRLSGGCGVLADGPERLLREYADVLKESDLEPYFPYPTRAPHWWDDEHRRWVDGDQNLSVLILGGSSYIVGTEFFANRLE
jgi:hypothetical protein